MTTATRTRPTVQQPARTPRPGSAREWPRPPLVHDHRQLFREPVYTGGQTYADDQDLEDDEPAG
ncbi:hypothetical protein [Streptomyces pilosus]|uniref:hypothetical protein n=1 Tax=Streptomyces pilosus TaxID=28893 RepID=UPI003632EC88